MRIEQVRVLLAHRLHAQRRDVEAAALDRIRSISPSGLSNSTAAAEDIQAVSAAIGYAIEALGSPGDQPPPLPSILLARARFAARDGMQLQTLVRRYFAGYAALGEFILRQFDDAGLARSGVSSPLFDDLARLIDRVVATIGGEYTRAAASRPRSPRDRKVDLVRSLLAGQLVDPAELPYGLDMVHLGLVAAGVSARSAVDRLAERFDVRRLSVDCDDTTVWAWLGSPDGFDKDALAAHLAREWPAEILLALGEPARALTGWRLTHRQARAALPIAQAETSGTAWYADVAVLTSARRDDLLRESLRTLYLKPLSFRRDSGALRETLHAYLAADRNASSAAARLHVDRRTVTSRLHTIEECLARPLRTCLSDLELALRLESLEETCHGLDLTPAAPHIGTSSQR